MIGQHKIYADTETFLVALDATLPFTKSNGTIMAKVYERLTKASRRRPSQGEGIPPGYEDVVEVDRESYYRKGVYDTLKALQDELA